MALTQAGGASMDMMAKSAALMQKYRMSSTAPNIFRMGAPGQANANFPVQLSTTDPEDQKWATMQKIMQQGGQVPNERGIIPGIGQAIVPGAFWDYVARKENADLLAQFQQFVLQQVDLSKPESANWWFTRFPWIRDLKLQEIETQAELQKRFAQIQVTGPQNEDDFLMIWMREQELIKVAETPLDKLYESKDIVSSTYKQGFFSPLAKQIPATESYPAVVAKRKWTNPVFGVQPASFPGLTGTYPNAGALAGLYNPSVGV
jgi:hypothetical protein